jgi:hypothetical protein
VKIRFKVGPLIWEPTYARNAKPQGPTKDLLTVLLLAGLALFMVTMCVWGKM